MIDEFLIRAALSAIGVALVAGPLGCFVVWRRMAYFGDATAHASLLGVALSLALSMPIFPGVLLAALMMALAVNLLVVRGIAQDTALGVLAHAALAIGLVAISLQNMRVDLLSYLLGDILAVSWADVALIWIGSGTMLGWLIWRWSALLTATLHPDMASASGLNPEREHLFLTLALALTVAVAIKVVGVLLISAMLLIPATTARGLVRTPEAMAFLAAAFGVVAALGGLQVSLSFDTPTGPTMVAVAAGAFAVSLMLSVGTRLRGTGRS
ncbi:MAG: metal ABC transporter permease [Pseudomonadota bacterium]